MVRPHEVRQSRCVVSQVTAPNDVCTLIPGTYAYGTCCGKRDFADVTKARCEEHAGSSG